MKCVPFFTTEQIQERIAALPRNPKRLTRAQIRQRLEELAITNPPKIPKNVVWS
jgi:hypothetical protein